MSAPSGSRTTSRPTGRSGRRCSTPCARAGIRNYTIFRDGTNVFGYFEADDLDAAAAHLAAQEVSTRWQDAMAELLEERVPDAGPPALEQIFRLD